jgi:hypothetical protein
MNKQWKRILLAAVIIAAAAQWVGAGIILNSPETWSTTPLLDGWTNAPINGVGSGNPNRLSNPANYLRITFSQQGGAPSYEDDVIYTTNANYTGSYLGHTSASNLAVQFRFYAEDVLPGLSEVYLHNANGDIWEYAFSGTVGSWIQQNIAFNYSAGWVGPGGASQFWSDLANIDWIGVYIVRNIDTIQQDYGIDDWQYYEVIPEPGVFSILAASFLSCAIALRKRRQHTVQKGP